jgi:hypothetical protein
MVAGSSGENAGLVEVLPGSTIFGAVALAKI